MISLVYVKMNLRIKTILLPLILIFTQMPCHKCQQDQKEICSQSFDCGNIRNIYYPFYGGNKPPYCGYPGFGLYSRYNICLFNSSSTIYQVLGIDYTSQTLRFVRQDLSNNTCPAVLRNTTLDTQLFYYPVTSNDRTITLFYGCNSSQVQLPIVPNQFIQNCTGNRTNGFSFYVTEPRSDPGFNISCNANVFVPVDEYYAGRLLETDGMSLMTALARGFQIQWRLNVEDCDVCLESGGVCGFNHSSYHFSCYCEDRAHAVSCPRNGGLSTREKITIVVSVVGFICIVIPSIILVYHFSTMCKSDNPIEESNHNVEKFIREHGSMAPRRYTCNEIKKMTKSFSDKLGQGGFGIVYKGTLPNGQHVAVKVLNNTSNGGEEFINEVASISRTSHVNIVNLLGFCYGKSKRALVYEFMPNKSLDKFINQNGSFVKDFQLEWEKLYQIAVGVARGLEYLHRGCNARIVHFDIKPQNILLDKDFSPKISDFGLAKLYRKKQSILTSVFGARGTIGYIAPEVFCRNFGSVSHKSDVYSYGMMVLEMAGAREIEESSGTVESSEKYFPDKIYEQRIVCKIENFDEIMSKEEMETVKKMFLIGFWCIQTMPSDRPSMSKVVEMFEGSIETIQIPPKPLLSSPMLSQQLFSASLTVDLGTDSINEV